MNILIIITLLLLIATWKAAGFCIVAITALIACTLFAARKVGYFCKMQNLVIIEGLGLFFLITFQLMIKHADPVLWLTLVALRGVSLMVMRHDIVNYVYVTEERRRD